MPPNIQNSLGWLDLQLRSQRLKDQQQQDFQREQMTREQGQQDIQNALAVGTQRMRAQADGENRKLQLAAMLQKAADDRALREQLANQTDTRVRRGQDLTNENQDLSRGLNQDKFDYSKLQDAIANGVRAYVAQTGRMGVVNPTNPLTGEKPYQFGPEMINPPSTGPEAPPATDRLPPGVTPTPPPKPGEITLTKKQKEEGQAKIGGDIEDLKDLDEAITTMEGPKVNKNDFGETGGRFSLFGITPNTAKDWLASSKIAPQGIKDWFGGEKELQAGAKVRSETKMKVERVINKMARKYGAALTETELGRVLDEAGLQSAMSGKLDITATDYPVLLQALKLTRQRMGESAERTSTELQTGKRTLPVLPGAVNPGQAAAPPPGPRQLPKDPMQRFKAILDANPGMSDEDAYRLATDPGADIGQ